MVYPANVVHVFIASPSDVALERQALREAIWEFNDEHTTDTGVVLLPRLWEKNGTPHIGAPPQAILDDQIVDSSDIVIGIFWTRIGQLLDDGKHATVHELERFVNAGKPALLYFSNTPVAPDSLDPKQYRAVQEFKKEIGKRSLYREYSGVAELVNHARRDLLVTVRRHFKLPVEVGPRAPQRTANVSARVERRGRDAYLIVENRGPGDARGVTVAWVSESIEEGFEAPWTHDMEGPISMLTEGSRFEFSILLHSGTPDRADLRIRWEDDDGPHEKVQTLSL
ncbi:MAG: hypothetical protein WA317_02540 [Mycobacterium sp.]|uniref:hypothetical protein n=1 Tax=Mycobacterium sp. TaxID=1785 RepID=UPI003CC5EF4C